MNQAMIRVMIVDDHPIVRQGIRSLLSNHADLMLCAEAEHAERAIEQAKDCKPDVILLDIRMPGMSGLDAIGALKWACPQAKVLMLSSFEDDEYLTRALQLGAYGYILKSASDERLVLAVRAAFNGERVLSPLMMDHLVKQVTDMGRERAQKQAGLSDDDVRLLLADCRHAEAIAIAVVGHHNIALLEAVVAQMLAGLVGQRYLREPAGGEVVGAVQPPVSA